MQKGRVVVMTGAAGGIGAKIVNRFMANENKVFAVDRTDSDLYRTLITPTRGWDEL